MKTFRIKHRVEPETLRIDLTGWSLQSLDDYIEKTSAILREIANASLSEFFLKATAEILEHALEEGLLAYISEDDNDDIVIRVALPFNDEGPVFEFSFNEIADLHGDNTVEGEIFAKQLRRLADRFDPPN
jgi:hypothetical protein